MCLDDGLRLKGGNWEWCPGFWLQWWMLGDSSLRRGTQRQVFFLHVSSSSALYSLLHHGLLIHWHLAAKISTLMTLTTWLCYALNLGCGREPGFASCSQSISSFRYAPRFPTVLTIIFVKSEPPPHSRQSTSLLTYCPQNRLYSQELPLTYPVAVCFLGQPSLFPSLLKKETLFLPKVGLPCVFWFKFSSVPLRPCFTNQALPFRWYPPFLAQPAC